MSDQRLLNGDGLGEPLGGIRTLENGELRLRVLVYEFINREETSAHADEDFATFDLDHDPSLSEHINAFGLAHERDFELAPVGEGVYVVSQLFVNGVSFHRYVDDSGLKFNNEVLEIVNFTLEALNLVLEALNFILKALNLTLKALNFRLC